MTVQGSWQHPDMRNIRTHANQGDNRHGKKPDAANPIHRVCSFHGFTLPVGSKK